MFLCQSTISFPSILAMKNVLGKTWEMQKLNKDGINIFLL